MLNGLISCCQLPPFSPPLPPQFNKSYDVQWIEQPVDHFNGLQPLAPNGRQPSFRQRLLFYNKSWAGPGSPVIFYTGAEGSGPSPPPSRFTSTVASSVRSVCSNAPGVHLQVAHRRNSAHRFLF